MCLRTPLTENETRLAYRRVQSRPGQQLFGVECATHNKRSTRIFAKQALCAIACLLSALLIAVSRMPIPKHARPAGSCRALEVLAIARICGGATSHTFLRFEQALRMLPYTFLSTRDHRSSTVSVDDVIYLPEYGSAAVRNHNPETCCLAGSCMAQLWFWSGRIAKSIAYSEFEHPARLGS